MMPVSIIKFIVVFMLTCFTGSVFAEYYVVYSAAGVNCVSCGCQGGCKKHHKYYKKHHYKKYYKKKSSCYKPKRYYVKHTCNTCTIPRCTTCMSGCPGFYVPTEYYVRDRTEGYTYYDNSPDFDMRTADDF